MIILFFILIGIVLKVEKNSKMGRVPEEKNIINSKIVNRKYWYANIYLKSEHWKNRRIRALKISKFKCQKCKCENKLQVHHLSYKNLWNEPDCDLIVVCDSCHKKIHNINIKKAC